MVSAIVLAAGSGSRMKSDIPKQFLEICGKPLICYALETFQKSMIDEIILVTRSCDIDYCREHIIGKNAYTKVTQIVAGGENRFDSVWNGIRATDPDSEIVMIHDGARPFVTQEMIEASIAAARSYRACTTAVPVKDTIKVVDSEMFGIRTPERNTLYQIQTPQTFERKLLWEAYEKMYESGEKDATDDTMIVERYMQIPAKIVAGSYRNIKVTTKEDIAVAEAFATR